MSKSLSAAATRTLQVRPAGDHHQVVTVASDYSDRAPHCTCPCNDCPWRLGGQASCGNAHDECIALREAKFKADAMLAVGDVLHWSSRRPL